MAIPTCTRCARAGYSPDPEVLEVIQGALTAIIARYATTHVQFTSIAAADCQILLPGTVNLVSGQLVPIIKDPAQQALLTVEQLQAAQTLHHCNGAAASSGAQTKVDQQRHEEIVGYIDRGPWASCGSRRR